MITTQKTIAIAEGTIKLLALDAKDEAGNLVEVTPLKTLKFFRETVPDLMQLINTITAPNVSFDYYLADDSDRANEVVQEYLRTVGTYSDRLAGSLKKLINALATIDKEYFLSKWPIHSILEVLNGIADTYKASIFPLPHHHIMLSPIPHDIILHATEKWACEHTSSSCWLEYQESGHLIPNDTAAVGVRNYVNGTLIYSMDGCMTHETDSKDEQVTVNENLLHLCRNAAKCGTIVIDGTIDIDLREMKDVYFRFVGYTVHK